MIKEIELVLHGVMGFEVLHEGGERIDACRQEGGGPAGDGLDSTAEKVDIEVGGRVGTGVTFLE